MAGYSHSSIMNWLPKVPQREYGLSLPIPNIPVIATWSSAHMVGSSVGQQLFTGIPPLCRFISHMYDAGSLYPSSSSMSAIIWSDGGSHTYSFRAYSSSSQNPSKSNPSKGMSPGADPLPFLRRSCDRCLFISSLHSRMTIIAHRSFGSSSAHRRA